MNEQEFNALISKIESSIGEKMDSKLVDAFKTVNPNILTAITENNSTELKGNIDKLVTSNTELKDAQKAQAGMIEGLVAKLSEANAGNKLSMKQQVSKLLSDSKDKLTAMKNGDNKLNIRFAVKAVGNMTLGSNVTGQIPQAERESGITRIVRRQPFYFRFSERRFNYF